MGKRLAAVVHMDQREKSIISIAVKTTTALKSISVTNVYHNAALSQKRVEVQYALPSHLLMQL